VTSVGLKALPRSGDCDYAIEPERHAIGRVGECMIEEERRALAAVILYPHLLELPDAPLTENAFAKFGERLLFRALNALHDRRDAIDLISLCAELERLGWLDRVGGVYAIQKLLDMYIVENQAESYVRTLVRNADKRTFESRAYDLVSRISADPTNAALLTEWRTLPDACTTSRFVLPDDEFLDLAAIARDGLAENRWVIPGWLALDDVGVLCGRANSGKTTLSYDLADAIARNRPWCGIQPALSGPTLVFDEEMGAHAAAYVLLAIARRFGGPHPNLHLASNRGLRLSEPAGVARLRAAIERVRPLVVILDSATKCFAVENENSSSQDGPDPVFRVLSQLRTEYDCAFLVLHHLRKPAAGIPMTRHDLLNALRGTTAYSANPSTIWGMLRAQGARTAVVHMIKRRLADEASIETTYTKTLAPDGKPIIEITAEPLESDEAKLAQATVWIASYLATHGLSRTGEIKAAGKAEGHTEATIKRGITAAANKGLIASAKQGWWSLVGESGTSQSFDEPDGSQP
jgi:hypothetical protein